MTTCKRSHFVKLLRLSVLFQQVFYPFDRNSIVTKERDGKKVFQINTSVGVWEYKGQKNYEIHVIYTNTVKIHWPQGTCAGPYAFE